MYMCVCISEYQSGFRPRHSTQDVLLYVTDQWKKAIDNSLYTGAVFLDIRKAFDCVNHSILIDKLANYGLNNSFLTWFKAYLFNRRQKVKCPDKSESGWGDITCGVPQGSILGPLLFLLYINDLPKVVSSCKIMMYADDTMLYVSDKSVSGVSHLIQEDINAISEWLRLNLLFPNVKKSFCMLIGSRQKLKGQVMSVYMGNHVVKHAEAVTYLGVKIDRHLTWDLQVKSVVKRAYARLFAIWRLQPLPSKVSTLLYTSFVLPLFDYCDVVWFSGYAKHITALDRVHNYAQKLTNFSLSGILSPVRRVEFHLLICVYKVLKNLCPSYLLGSFKYTTNVTNHHGRNPNRLYIPSIKTNYGKFSFYYRGATVWNRLPSDLYNCSSLQSFKSLYKNTYS